MATAAQYAFILAVAQAEGVRQAAKAAALVAYGFVAANFATYQAAILSADQAYVLAVKNAAATNSQEPFYGQSGPIAGQTANLDAPNYP